jgi:hypothetical protein
MKMSNQDGTISLELVTEEAELLDNLVSQLILLLQSHSDAPLDPDPVLANLDIGGTTELPVDPALARLFPNAFSDDESSAEFRSLTEQGLVNRKLADSAIVSQALSDHRLNKFMEDHDDDPLVESLKDHIPDSIPDDFGDSEQAASDDDEGGLSVSIRVTPDMFEAWLRTLNAIRLAMAARIDIVDENSHADKLQDPDSRASVMVYDWIGVMIEGFLQLGTDTGE